jgi:type IV pilus assembly protein PilE
MYTFRRSSGFTLMELMVAMAVIGILAGIAYPSYSEYIARAKRSDAKSALLQVQIAQEKYRANHVIWGTLAQIGLTSPSPDGHYTIAIALSGTPTGIAYTATAAPLTPFTDATCGTFAVDQDGKTTSSSIQTTTAKVIECWSK